VFTEQINDDDDDDDEDDDDDDDDDNLRVRSPILIAKLS